ncbi:hypothetical protein E2320_001038 [Naja naja]|nr:hypothetical protein E2320_001038 [Naja naja]
MDGAQRQRIIRTIWPQLVDFLSDHSEWVLKKAEMLLSQGDLRLIDREPDLKMKHLLVLDMVLRDVDANPEVFRNFIQKLERRRPISNLPDHGKESKQKRFDAAERYRQCILSSMFRKYGISHSAEAVEMKDQPLAFSQKFVNHVIYQSKASKLKVGVEKIKEEPMAPQESKDHGIPMMNLSELFKSVQMDITQVVQLLGKAGTGKTWLVHKICQQWAKGVFPQFKLIFFFEFKQLNLIKRKLTLQELLFDYFLQPDQPEAVFRFLLENAQQNLVILDGLDELMENTIGLPPISFSSSSDVVIPLSVSDLVANLCHGKFLPGCTVLITSRLKLLPTVLVRSTILPAEIWGFNRDKVEEYVSYFFQQPLQKEQALALLDEKGKLLSMCYLPVLCHIVCICLEHLLLEDSESIHLPQTRTQVYLTMLQTFICKHQGRRTLNEIDMAQHQAILADLCEIAFKGLEEKKGVFDDGEVPKHVKDFSCRFGLLLTSEVKMGKQAGYTFAHFSWQEFFAVLFLLTSPKVDCKMLKENFFLRKKWIQKKETRMLMPFDMVTLAFLISGSPHGVCLDFDGCLMELDYLDIWGSCGNIRSLRLTGGTLRSPGFEDLVRVLPNCHQLEEINLSYNEMSVGTVLAFSKAAANCPKVSKLQIRKSILIISFANLSSKEPRLKDMGINEEIAPKPRSLILQNYNFHDVQLNQCQQMEVTSKKIRLAGNHFHDEDLRNLCLVLRKCSSILELDLSNNSFGDSGVLKIMDSIKVLKNLNYLILDNNQMSLDGVISLLKFFSRLEHITSFGKHPEMSLKLWRTNQVEFILIIDEQVQPSQQACQEAAEKPLLLEMIFSFSLEGCPIGLDMTRLLTILTKCSGLAEINLSGNSLNDQDIEQMVLCLSSLRSLRFLSIRDNAFSSNGICLLANSFNHCRRISEMNIRFIHCGIDQPDLRALCAVFENCDHLAELDLSGNDLDNEGLRWIFEHLPKIQNSCSLKINHNGISPDGVLLLVNLLVTKDDVVEVQASLCPEKMLLITLRKQDKPQKILSLKKWNLRAEQLAQLLNRLKECTVLSNFISINNGLTLRSAKTLLKSLRRLTGMQKICIEEQWVTDESFYTFLSLAAEVQGEVITIMKTGSHFMLEQKFPPQVGKGEFVVNRTSRTLFPDAEGPTSSDALMHFPALQKLWLTDGRIPPASIEYVAEILQRGFAIEDINRMENSEQKNLSQGHPKFHQPSSSLLLVQREERKRRVLKNDCISVNKHT